MSQYNRGNYYGSNNYTARSNSFSEDGPGAKRRRSRPAKKNQVPNIEALFKEPVAPPLVRSPIGPPRQGGRDNTFRSGAMFGNRQDNQYSDFHNFNSQFAEPSWYWDNYNKSCQSWQDKHQLAYYRSRCLALEFENQMLFEQISSLIQENCIFAEERGEMPSMRLVDLEGQKAEVPAAKSQASNKQAPTKNQGKNKPKVNSPPAADDPTNVNGDDKLEAEVCQTMLEVIETSLRHKINLKKTRKQGQAASKSAADEGTNGVKKVIAKKQTAAEQQEEMELLYGKESNQIHKLETSLQLKYNRFCDTHKPELWMALPLNPNVAVAE